MAVRADSPSPLTWIAWALILIGLPSTAAWAIGILAGINMLFFGVALLAMDKALSDVFDD